VELELSAAQNWAYGFSLEWLVKYCSW